MPEQAESALIRIGTRGSALARWQANWVAEQLAALGMRVELVPIATQGDLQQQGPIGAIGTSGVFTKELQRALLDGRIDLAVHSLKDLPTESVEGLCLAAVPPRESAADALISREGQTLEKLPQGARIGTGSMRRRSQLWHGRRDLKLLDVRGNVDTRLKKLRDGEYDALVLAEAGLNRLGLRDQITQVLPFETMLPAVGQGALGLEARADDRAVRAAVQQLDDSASHAAVLAERGMLAKLLGGCLAPVGAWGRIGPDGRLLLRGTVLSADGRERLVAGSSAEANAAADLGRRVAQLLLDQGAGDLIQKSRQR